MSTIARLNLLPVGLLMQTSDRGKRFALIVKNLTYLGKEETF